MKCRDKANNKRTQNKRFFFPSFFSLIKGQRWLWSFQTTRFSVRDKWTFRFVFIFHEFWDLEFFLLQKHFHHQISQPKKWIFFFLTVPPNLPPYRFSRKDFLEGQNVLSQPQSRKGFINDAQFFSSFLGSFSCKKGNSQHNNSNTPA